MDLQRCRVCACTHLEGPSWSETCGCGIERATIVLQDRVRCALCCTICPLSRQACVQQSRLCRKRWRRDCPTEAGAYIGGTSCPSCEYNTAHCSSWLRGICGLMPPYELYGAKQKATIFQYIISTAPAQRPKQAQWTAQPARTAQNGSIAGLEERLTS